MMNVKRWQYTGVEHIDIEQKREPKRAIQYEDYAIMKLNEMKEMFFMKTSTNIYLKNYFKEKCFSDAKAQ